MLEGKHRVALGSIKTSPKTQSTSHAYAPSNMAKKPQDQAPKHPKGKKERTETPETAKPNS